MAALYVMFQKAQVQKIVQTKKFYIQVYNH